eukprot:TRINITY_DN27446_c0_g1_i1.p1 TRINITY_DN27446_c0_g1~~TRINITY_DN27446_c0_g1_i1.p1  ORF type:complete len:226 (+),score=38.71 TRINITY_DN27446_c0_g1_i1:35-712(+)
MVQSPQRSPLSSSSAASDVYKRQVRNTWNWITGAKPPREFDPWREAKRRSNCTVLVKLKDRKSEEQFCVATYHMPCLFGSDQKCQVMVIHASLLLQHAQRFAGGLPLVVAGDFNLKPHDVTYALMRDGKMSKDHPWWPEGPTDWKCEPMRSAYAIKGGEPEFTNYAKTREGDPSFCEVLDYIWLSPQWGVASVDALPEKKSLKGESFPSSTEPSDNVLLAANLNL